MTKPFIGTKDKGYRCTRIALQYVCDSFINVHNIGLLLSAIGHGYSGVQFKDETRGIQIRNSFQTYAKHYSYFFSIIEQLHLRILINTKFQTLLCLSIIFYLNRGQSCLLRLNHRLRNYQYMFLIVNKIIQTSFSVIPYCRHVFSIFLFNKDVTTFDA